jgi:hypothetical protein
MAYGFVQDVPANEVLYRQIRELLPTDAPKGMVVHLVLEREGGLRYIDVWDSEADWDRFRTNHVEPAVAKVPADAGIPHGPADANWEPVKLVDVWLPLSADGLELVRQAEGSIGATPGRVRADRDRRSFTRAGSR